MDASRLPTIAAIQRLNVILAAVTAAIFAVFDSAATALACILGAAVVIANLWILAALGRVLLAAAGAGVSGASAKLGMLAIPLKLFIVIGIVYLVFARAKVDGIGFGAGVLTQMAAIIIETGRVSARRSREIAKIG
ncbi:MAG TPA: hypothetical protein VMT58_01925 [Candidatus Binataceae bacterium]|nr:hypothetical protein [Candidatus Binataceae bacterium]